jgi:tRNA threonylcarbamoyladenosine biosynthesis protein TsaE
VYHVDLYRLSGLKECVDLGLVELLTGRSLVLIEWPERAGSLIPRDSRRLRLGHVAGRADVRSLQVLE